MHIERGNGDNFEMKKKRLVLWLQNGSSDWEPYGFTDSNLLTNFLASKMSNKRYVAFVISEYLECGDSMPFEKLK